LWRWPNAVHLFSLFVVVLHLLHFSPSSSAICGCSVRPCGAVSSNNFVSSEMPIELCAAKASRQEHAQRLRLLPFQGFIYNHMPGGVSSSLLFEE
jgi:hypothetical protein